MFPPIPYLQFTILKIHCSSEVAATLTPKMLELPREFSPPFLRENGNQRKTNNELNRLCHIRGEGLEGKEDGVRKRANDRIPASVRRTARLDK